ncbi:uncharacterized protein LOC136075946 [Hydra vulgaris]|uniref:Uncharacterized protein LOC136075946 n=1 Tax=Hydra vulgaris TaxID=6087 RepID=A0ABM4B9B1_HYDVU
MINDIEILTSLNRKCQKKKSYENSRSYRSEWEKELTWIKKSSNASEQASCRLCRTNISPHKGSLEQHQNAASHIKREKTFNPFQKKINFPGQVKISDVNKKADIQLAMCICCHSAISTADHFCEIISKFGVGSPLEHLKLHRTKCTKVIQNVISSTLEEEISKEIKSKPFSILIDESTDVSLIKHLAICVRYFSEKEKQIVDDFLGLIQVISTTCEDLFNALNYKLHSIGLTLENCIGYSSDGASNVIGRRNSVWSRVLSKSPNCIMMRCICHSLNLVVQNAFNAIPSPVGFLLSEVPRFFNKSILRRNEYEKLFELMNPNNKRVGTPSPF